MIDTLIVKSTVGAPQPHHLECLAQVSFTRFNITKSKPTTTFIDSPITGAQMQVKYWIERRLNREMAFIELTIPLASATIGQNYFHAGLDSIADELKCASLLAQLILFALGFKSDEVQLFRDRAEGKLCELTWHTPTASTRALQNLQSRTAKIFEAMKAVSSHHDIQVKDVDCRRKNGMPGLLATFKNGDQFRQYGKFDQTATMSKKGKHRYELSMEMQAHKHTLLETIKFHARNELRLCEKTFRSLEMQNPINWSPEKMKAAIDLVWKNAGLTVMKTDPKATTKELSPEAQVTLDRYFAGTLKDTLLPHTFSRHRKAIKAFNGIDIAQKLVRKEVKAGSVGAQLQYGRRLEPKGDLRKLVLCEESAPDIIIDLKRGLDYVQFGVLPELPKVELDAWQKRWKKFADQKGSYNDTSSGKPKASPKLCDPIQTPTSIAKNVLRQFARGISAIPVNSSPPDDELICIDGEWMVI
jgi:hypothetical protein